MSNFEEDVMTKYVQICIIFVLFQIANANARGAGNNLTFDGMDDWLNCGINELGINDSITIEAWVYASNIQPVSYGRILDKFNYNDQSGFNLVLEFPTSGGSAMFDFFATDNSENAIQSKTKINDNHWHFVAATFDGSEMRMYVDGILENQLDIGSKTIKASTNFLGIGNNSDGSQWWPFKGSIDEIRLWNTTLDSISIRNWMYKNIDESHPEYNHLAGYWQFNQNATSQALDNSTYMNNGTLTNMDSVTAWHVSTAPIASELTSNLTDLAAVWASRDSNASSIFSVIDSIRGDGSLIFGHDDASLSWIDSDVPTGKNIIKRLDRTWRFEVYDTSQCDEVIDLHNLVTSGDEVVLLSSQNESFTNADTITGELSQSGRFYINNYSVQHGYYYTIGLKSNPTGIDNRVAINKPHSAELLQNYPNPFNPDTKITYHLAHSTRVVLYVYNTRGQIVRTLVRNRQSSGMHSITWDGRNKTGRLMSSGLYFYQLKTDNFIQTRQMLFLK